MQTSINHIRAVVEYVCFEREKKVYDMDCQHE